MKRAIFLIMSVIALAGLILPAQGDDTNAKPEVKADAKKDDKADAKAEPKKEEQRVTRDTNGFTVVKLDTETQKLILLKTEALAGTQLAPEIKTYGRVMDPGPLAVLMTDLASAEVAHTASSNELARLKTLAASGNASAKALQAAEATELRDRLQEQSSRDRIILTWGKWMVDQPDLPEFIRSLSTLENALVRVDLPAGRQIKSPPLGARVVSLSGTSADAEVLGWALGVDPQTQGQGIVLQIKANASRFLVGESVTAYLKMPGDPLTGVTVPREAIVRNGGATWAYVQSAEEQFTRKEMALEHPVENGWFVTNGIAAGDKVVVAGAQTLLSEELKGSFSAPSD